MTFQETEHGFASDIMKVDALYSSKDGKDNNAGFTGAAIEVTAGKHQLVIYSSPANRVVRVWKDGEEMLVSPQGQVQDV